MFRKNQNLQKKTKTKDQKPKTIFQIEIDWNALNSS